ncbi:MAG: ribonuclease HIII [Parachlamydiaceae bacterium]
MNPFVTTINASQEKTLLAYLKENDFELSKPAYTKFLAKKPNLSVTLFESGKLVVQGKEAKAFIEFFLQPEVTHDFGQEERFYPHIGIDESGKGDFFGPLCIAGVYADEKGIAALKEWGVKDSKTLTDNSIDQLARKIKTLHHHIVIINPAKYNEIYPKFGNLNSLLAWGHATAIEALYEQSGCEKVIIDQFADERVVLSALKRKGIALDLDQRHRGEEDLVVAAASIIARDTFVKRLKKLSEEFDLDLPKGASKQVVEIGKRLYLRHGEAGLSKVSKLHFKTLDQIRNNS